MMPGNRSQKRVAHSWAAVQLCSPCGEEEVNSRSQKERHPLLFVAQWRGGVEKIFLALQCEDLPNIPTEYLPEYMTSKENQRMQCVMAACGPSPHFSLVCQLLAVDVSYIAQ